MKNLLSEISLLLDEENQQTVLEVFLIIFLRNIKKALFPQLLGYLLL